MESLDDMRKSIDNIDNAIIAMFAERFKITDRIGTYKAHHKLPAKDAAREEVQFARVLALAEQYGLDQNFAQQYLRSMIDQVIARHQSQANLQ